VRHEHVRQELHFELHDTSKTENVDVS
jgi:hypothetical protein